MRKETKQNRPKLEAIIKHDGDEKYIVAKVGDNGSSRLMLVSLALEYHSNIANVLRKWVNGNVEVRGGGILEIDREAKRIRTYGMSGGFGKPNVKEVERILKKNFPNYTIDAKVDDYVRG